MFKARRIVSQLPPSSVSTFSDRVGDAPGLVLDDAYSVFTFGPMHTQHLGIKRVLKMISTLCLLQGVMY